LSARFHFDYLTTPRSGQDSTLLPLTIHFSSQIANKITPFLMDQQPSQQDRLDFTHLTEAIIPSKVYMSSWDQANQPTPSQTSPLSFDMFTPTFGNMFYSSDAAANPLPSSNSVSPSEPAYNVSSVQRSSAATPMQYRGVGNALHPLHIADFFQITKMQNQICHQLNSPIPGLSTSNHETPLPVSAKDSLATLKMRAKESVLAKRSQSVRSTSYDSKNGLKDVTAPTLTQTAVDVDKTPVLERASISGRPDNTIPIPLMEHAESLDNNSESLTKGISADLEDLLAQGKAAAASSNTGAADISQANGSLENDAKSKRMNGQDTSVAGEIRDDSTQPEGVVMTTHQAAIPTEHFAGDEIDEIDEWLTMTGYYDKHYRDKVLGRRKRLREIEEERLRLLLEEQEEQRFAGQFHHGTPIFAGHLSHTPTTTIPHSFTTPRKDVGVRIKGSAVRTERMLETPSTDAPSVKRRAVEEIKGVEACHKPKVARTEVVRNTSPGSSRPSPERIDNRPASPRNTEKHETAPLVRESSPNKAGYNRWLPDRESETRGRNDRRRNEIDCREEIRGRHDSQRRDSGLGVSPALKTNLREGRVRFFLLKSWNFENIAKAQREGTWATQMKNEDTFVEAFKTCRHVIFFFSANHSKAFQGYARMQCLPGEKGVPEPSWVKRLHWPTTPPFRLRWIVKDETPYRAVGNMKNPLNENLAVFVGRDGQEIPEKLGIQLCDIIDEDTAYRAEYRR
jgi:YTH domain-containing protein 1